MTALLPGGVREDPDDGSGDDSGDVAWTRPRVPGWDLWFDLTPPELVNARRVRVLRRWIGVGLVGIVLVVLGGWFLTTMSAGRANSALADEQARTTGLQASQRSYAAVVGVTGATTQVRQQLAGLLAEDVDTSGVLGALRAALPGTVSLQQVQLTVDANTGAAAGGADTSLDTSGRPHIGTVTLTGKAGTVDGVAAYVAALGRVPGLTDVVPTSSASSDTGYTFTVTAAVTDRVLTHRFEVRTPKPAAPDAPAASGAPAAPTTGGFR